jgi:sigma-B regulation protein RsbU (phosphoserine phosphatase)
MSQPRLLPPTPALVPPRRAGARLRHFLVHQWSGRILIASLAIRGADLAGAAVPCGLDVLATIALFVFGVWGLVRLGRFLVRRLLWRIRSKLLVSYLFIAVVPVVLLLLLFGLAGVLFSGLVASYIVTSEIARSAALLRTTGEAALADMSGDDAAARAALDRHLEPLRAVHPELTFALWDGPRSVAASAGTPAALPEWTRPEGYAGLVRMGEDDDATILTGIARLGPRALLVQVPVDEHLFAPLEEQMGIQLVPEAVRVRRGGHGMQILVGSEARRPAAGEAHRPAASRATTMPGMRFAATPEARHWVDGKADLAPMFFHFQPLDLLRHLSPGALNVGDILVKALAGVAAVFLIVYGVALVLGLMLARSITGNIHELYRGTERLRQGDFGNRIRVQSRDQLGELAESFNVMAASMQGLLMEQAEKQRLEEELRIARQIQMSLLPQGAITLPGLRVSALCLPAAEVGGDYYDLLPLSATRMGVLVADVSGKGTSAALYMAELKGLVLSLSRIYESPARLLSEANRILAATLDARSFITMTYAVVDTAARTMRYARAGHNPMIQYDAATGLTRVLTPAGLGLGIDSGARFDEILEEAEVPLRGGDVFLFFTDGLSEAMNGRAELFGERRLRDVIESADRLGEDESALKDRILAAIRAFVGEAAQHDDMTMVILKVV